MRRALFTARCVILLVLCACAAMAQSGNILRFSLHNEPRTFNPLQVTDGAADTIRYLTAGVLVRLNRQTQQLEPELAKSWKLSKDGRSISFQLRDSLRFSDGTPLTAADVAFTVQQMMDPAKHSNIGDMFRSAPGDVQTQVASPARITITFPAPVSALDRLFDQVAIMSANSPKKEMAVAGPFAVEEYKPGSSVLLQRNPNYWKKDPSGRQLPYLDSIQLDIQANRDIEALRFRRGELDLITPLDSEQYEKLAQQAPATVRDSGPSLDSEGMWFNQVPDAPIPPYKRDWFRSTDFRRAVSDAINRADLCRVVFASHARPAYGPVSPANRFWFNAKLPAPLYDRDSALRRLQSAGFRMDGTTLKDSAGNAVEFSLITNSGNKYRERMAAMIQQDLASIGMKVNVVTLDFPSLIERISEKFNYEAVLLGMGNVELDPSSQMNVWLSSADTHQWNPKQKTPATAWEAEIDKLMRLQASTTDRNKRKAAFDRVQQIVYQQAPYIFLVNKNALAAVSNNLDGVVPVGLRPQVYWNVEQLRMRNAESAKR